MEAELPPLYAGVPIPGLSGFFDDEEMLPRGGRGGTDIRAHLDDLAQRHPEFAAQLRGPAWGSDMWTGGPADVEGATGPAGSHAPSHAGSGPAGSHAASHAGSGPAGSHGASHAGNHGASHAGSGLAGSHAGCHAGSHAGSARGGEPGKERGRARNNGAGGGGLPHHGLRNTVPDMGQRQASEECKEGEAGRGQRSWSAPPDGRAAGAPPPARQQPARFVSRISINPVNPDDPAAPPGPAGDGPHQQQPPTQAADNHGKPPPVPKQQQQAQHPKPASNVRHIPIFVEGRDEPILPKNVDAEQEAPASPYQQQQQHFSSQAEHQFHPQQQSRPFPQQKRPFQSPQSHPPQQHKQPNRSFNTSPRPFMQHPQEQQQQAEDPRPMTPEPPRPKVANDPISRVRAIQKEVDALREQVDKYSGTSRQDREYVYLDEMLTRNLIKLDDIETEGKENIRVARKEAIRSIQQCIGTLEGKVPLPPSPERRPMEEGGGPEGAEATAMEVEERAEEPPSRAPQTPAAEGATTSEQALPPPSELAGDVPTKTDEEKPKD